MELNGDGTVFLGVKRMGLWLGRFLSGVAIAFLLFDAGIKLVPIPQVTTTMEALGYGNGVDLARGLGVLTLLCTALYAVPRTAPIGAVLLTGLLGGAIASQLRVGAPIFSHLLFGAYLGILVWVGLYLRDPRVRQAVRPRAS